MVPNWKCIASSFPCGVESEFPTKLMIEKLPFGFGINTDVKDLGFQFSGCYILKIVAT